MQMEVVTVVYRPMYVDKIMVYVDSPFVKILTGVRRCGKSTLLKMIIEELKKKGVPEHRIVSYRFDSMKYERLPEIHDNYPKYVLMADDFAGGNYEGIKTMHIADFLLGKDF